MDHLLPTQFNKINDLCRLAVDFANEVYYFDDADESDPPTERTKELHDHHDMVVGDGVRIYQIHCHLYQPQEDRELSTLYLAECGEKKYAFIAWKGTNSVKQAWVDVEARILSFESWNHLLHTIAMGFLEKLPAYLTEKGINAQDYEWYTTGHSLGGALAFYSAFLIKANPALILNGNLVSPITFASMKMPVPLPLPDGSDFSHNNQGLVFYNDQDRAVAFASENELKRLGKVLININYLAAGEKIYHSLANYVDDLSRNYIVLSEEHPNDYRVLSQDADYSSVQW